MDPDDGNAYAFRAWAWAEKREFEKVVADCSQILRLNPNCAWAFSHRGWAHGQLARIDEALADLDAAIRLDSNESWSFGVRGQFRLQKGLLAEAQQDFAAVARLNAPQAVVAKTPDEQLLAFLRDALERADETARSATTPRLLAQDDDAWLGRHVLAKHRDVAVFAAPNADDKTARVPACGDVLCEVLEARGEWLRVAQGWLRRDETVAEDQAADHFSETIRLAPTAFAYCSRGRIHFERGQYDEACDDFTDAMRFDPRCALACYFRGLARWRQAEPVAAAADVLHAGGLYAAAFKNLVCSKQADPADDKTDSTEPSFVPESTVDELVNSALIRIRQREYRAAIQDLDQAVARKRDHARAYYLRAQARAEGGQLDEAIRDLSESLRCQPMAAPAFLARGWLWCTKQAYDLALRDLDDAVRLDPRAQPYVMRGSLRVITGDEVGALADYEQAIRVDASYSEAYRGKSWVLSRRGDALGAYEADREAFRLAPKRGSARLWEAAASQPAVDPFGQPVSAPEKANAASGEVTHFRRFVEHPFSAPEKANEASGQAAPGVFQIEEHPFTKTLQQFRGTVQSGNPPAEQSAPPKDEVRQHEAIKSPEDRVRSERRRVLKEANELNNRAWRWATSNDERYRDATQAVEAATKACERTGWKQPAYLDTLAAAYAESGDFDAAVMWQSKAPEFWSHDAEFQRQALERLELYRRRQPYREGR